MPRIKGKTTPARFGEFGYKEYKENLNKEATQKNIKTVESDKDIHDLLIKRENS